MRRNARFVATVVTAALAAAGCAPRAGQLAGAVTPQVRLPRSVVPAGSHRVTFEWEYREQDGFSARGDGVARVTAPDSARMDFFVTGGFGGGWALLIGDALTIPGPDFVRRFIPPAPMLWAALGRLAIPAAPDTTARTSGDTLRADVGRDPTWRVTFVGPTLSRVERIDGGRIVEWLSRDSTRLRYENEAGRRSLTLRVQRVEQVSGFESSIWRR